MRYCALLRIVYTVPMKSLNTSPLDTRIRKLEQLRELVADPEMVALFLEMVGISNGHKPQEPAKTAAKTNITRRQKTNRGEILEAAKKVLPALPANFTSRELTKAMKASGYAFTAKSETIAISGVLQRLSKKGLVKRTDDQTSKQKATYKYAA
jgi:hypothetical protein